MPQQVKLPPTTEEEALGRIISWLKTPKRNTDPVSRPDYGHDLYVPNVILDCLDEVANEHRSRNPRGMITYQFDEATGVEPFYGAAWNLCRRGILHPDITRFNARYNTSMLIGAGFTVTPYGKRWLDEISGYECLPSEYGRFAQLLARHAKRFGDGYHARSQEAVGCYQAHTYLACCAMCGASAESIMLAIAIAKRGDEETVLQEYKSASGRSKVERMITGQQPGRIQQEFTLFMSLLKYWRDEAAHGSFSSIDEEEAFTTLILLLRFAQFADDRWEQLTQ
jgi:hypothetical protein